jgi:hypothetical protein
MTRLWAEGQAIDVKQDGQGVPVAFTWVRQTHRVAQLAQQWRVDVGWWRQRVWRAYYKLSTDSGLLVVIYHELPDGDWYLQRLYD